ncbi:hypothetical protein K439DRAFT_1623653 [Ramaria rubella]|nr:hypothetical protein K439DRAFT_1623653 [Ramaria rubella]
MGKNWFVDRWPLLEAPILTSLPRIITTAHNTHFDAVRFPSFLHAVHATHTAPVGTVVVLLWLHLRSFIADTASFLNPIHYISNPAILPFRALFHGTSRCMLFFPLGCTATAPTTLHVAWDSLGHRGSALGACLWVSRQFDAARFVLLTAAKTYPRGSLPMPIYRFMFGNYAKSLCGGHHIMMAGSTFHPLPVILSTHAPLTLLPHRNSAPPHHERLSRR